MNPNLMSINQVAEELGWSRTTVCRLIDQGILEVVRGVRKNRRVLRRSVDALIYEEHNEERPQTEPEWARLPAVPDRRR